MKDMRTRRFFALAYFLFSPFLLATTPEHGDECLNLRCTRVLGPDYDFSNEEMGNSSSAFVFNTPNFTTPWYLWGAHNRDEGQEPGLLWQRMKTFEGWDQLDPTLPARVRLQDSFDGDLSSRGNGRKLMRTLLSQTRATLDVKAPRPSALLAQKFVPTMPQDLCLDLMRLPFETIELLSFENIMPSSPDLPISPPRLAICHPPVSSQEVVRFLTDLHRAPKELAVVGVSFSKNEADYLIGWARDMRLSTLALLEMKGSVSPVFAKGLHYHFPESLAEMHHPYPLRHLVLGADAPLTPIIKRADRTIAGRPRYFPAQQVISQDWQRLRVDAPSMLTRTSPIPNPTKVSEIMRLLRIIAK